MNAIDYALKQIRYEIPEEILQMTFGVNRDLPRGRLQEFNTSYSLDHNINRLVISERVLTDMNLIGGKRIIIPLRNTSKRSVDVATRVYEIPHELTGGLQIVTVQSINFWDTRHALIRQGFGDGQVIDAVNFSRALATLPIVGTANVTLIGPNQVLVRDAKHFINDNYALILQVEHDPDLLSLTQGAYKPFSEACILATKAHIYRNKVVVLNRGQLYAGMELSVISEIINEYRDANQMYNEFYEQTLKRVLFTNDRGQMREFIHSMVGRGL